MIAEPGLSRLVVLERIRIFGILSESPFTIILSKFIRIERKDIILQKLYLVNLKFRSMKLCTKMLVKMPFRLKTLATAKSADEWLFPSMRSHMGFKVTTFAEPLATHFTGKRFFSCVASQMNFKSVRALEFLNTIRTVERTLASMSTFVIYKMTLGCEALTTEVTQVGTLFCVNANVSLEISFLCERFSTESTSIWPNAIVLFLMMSKGT